MRLLLLILLLPISLLAQVPLDSTSSDIPIDPTVLEDYLQALDVEADIDFNAIFEDLEAYRENPLLLNKCNEDDLRELNLLNDVQILNIINYREQAGDLISIYELQAIPSFDLETIQRILPYVAVKKNVDDFNLSILKMITEGDNVAYARWRRVLEEQKGYQTIPGEQGPRYKGDQNAYYFRYKHSYSNKLSYGVTAEKDAGEEFFQGSNAQGFDFYSAHFYLRDYNSTLKALALGDYSISFGQGLILFSGFGYGKSAQVTSIKKTGRVIRPYSSVNEGNFMRGAAATLGFGKNIEFTAFGSVRNRDGNVNEPDTLAEAEFRSISSIDIDGLHRTESEIADENAFKQTTVGASLRWKNRKASLSLNALYDQFDIDLVRNIDLYNQFSFSDKSNILNVSVDYSYIYQNINFFGETAMSDNGSLASMNGLLVGLDRKVDLALLHRYYPVDYQALNADPFGETSGGDNETGLYMGILVRPAKRWTLSAYFDAWKHPWLRFQADAPTRGYEYRTRLTYYKKRKTTVYLELRNKNRQLNEGNNDANLNRIVDNQLFTTRLHIANKLTKALELRNRVDVGFFKEEEEEVNTTQRGFMILQDVIYKPIAFPLEFSARYAIFNTDGYDVRFYNYENDLLNSFSVPAYYHKGSRFYLNLRYRGIRNLVLEARFAQTYWANQTSISSGNDEIDPVNFYTINTGVSEYQIERSDDVGVTRSDVKFQIKYKF